MKCENEREKNLRRPAVGIERGLDVDSGVLCPYATPLYSCVCVRTTTTTAVAAAASATTTTATAVTTTTTTTLRFKCIPVSNT